MPLRPGEYCLEFFVRGRLRSATRTVVIKPGERREDLDLAVESTIEQGGQAGIVPPISTRPSSK